MSQSNCALLNHCSVDSQAQMRASTDPEYLHLAEVLTTEMPNQSRFRYRHQPSPSGAFGAGVVARLNRSSRISTC